MANKLVIRLKTFRAAKTLPNVEIPTELIDKVIAELESHDERVTSLIRAVSTEVIKRREINAHRKILMQAVQKFRDQFRFYAKNHRAKDFSQLTAEGIKATLDKAATNDALADEADMALTWQIEEGAMGKP